MRTKPWLGNARWHPAHRTHLLMPGDCASQELPPGGVSSEIAHWHGPLLVHWQASSSCEQAVACSGICVHATKPWHVPYKRTPCQIVSEFLHGKPVLITIFQVIATSGYTESGANQFPCTKVNCLVVQKFELLCQPCHNVLEAMAQVIYATKYVFEFPETTPCQSLCLESERAPHMSGGSAPKSAAAPAQRASRGKGVEQDKLGAALAQMAKVRAPAQGVQQEDAAGHRSDALEEEDLCGAQDEEEGEVPRPRPMVLDRLSTVPQEASASAPKKRRAGRQTAAGVLADARRATKEGYYAEMEQIQPSITDRLDPKYAAAQQECAKLIADLFVHSPVLADSGVPWDPAIHGTASDFALLHASHGLQGLDFLHFAGPNFEYRQGSSTPIAAGLARRKPPWQALAVKMAFAHAGILKMTQVMKFKGVANNMPVALLYGATGLKNTTRTDWWLYILAALYAERALGEVGCALLKCHGTSELNVNCVMAAHVHSHTCSGMARCVKRI